MTAPDTTPAAVAERVARWRADVLDRAGPTGHNYGSDVSLRAAVDLIEALAAELARVTAERDAAAAEADRLRDLPLCRRQLPDGTVPTGTEAALALWHREATRGSVALHAVRENCALLLRHADSVANDNEGAAGAVEYANGIAYAVGEIRAALGSAE